MKDLNRATILGRATRDTELRTTASGKKVAVNSVVTNKTWTDSNGNKQENAQFHNIVLWDKLAEIAGEHLKKGTQVYVEGELNTRDWIGKDEKKNYKTEIVVEGFKLLGSKKQKSKAEQHCEEHFGVTE